MLGQTPHAHRQQTVFDGRRIVRQLVAAGGFVVREFQAVQRARRGQSRAAKGRIEPVPAQRIELVASRGQEGIAAQEGVVIEILVTQRQPVKPLGQKLGQRMINKAGVARIAETGGQRAGQTQAVIDLAQQQHAAVTGEVAGGEVGDDLACPEIGKEQRLVMTDCRRSGGGAGLRWACIHSLSDALPAPLFNHL